MNLTIANIPVRQDETGRYLLNDLHRAAGGENRHRPKYFLGSQQTQELIEELSIGGNSPIVAKTKIGTYGCKEMVYCYAMWISPVFHLKVIRAYDALVTGYPEPHAVRPGQAEALRREREFGEPITPDELAAILSRPVLIPAAEYLALKAGKAGIPAEHSNGQHYSDAVRAEVLSLGDKGWMPAEIAERTGVPRATVHTMLFRARKEGKIAKGPRQGTLMRDAKKGGVQ